jgi:glycosyltransferase involved in cell wall biosynthesis
MRISLVMTSYNRPNRIGATLRSIARQTVQPEEIIVSDDRSPLDPSSEVDRHRHIFKQSFTYVRQTKNLGMPGNLNYLFSRAKGDIVINIHDADEFDDSYLEELVVALSRTPDIGLAYTGWKFIDGRYPPHVPSIAAATNGRLFFKERMMRSLSCPIWGTVAMKREVLDQHQLLNPEFGPLADVDYWARVCLTHRIGYVAKPLLILYPEGTHGNCWLWSRYNWGRNINRVNIRRHLENSPKELGRELVRHRLRYLIHYCFGQLHLIRRGRWDEFGIGLRLFPRVLSGTN